MVITVKSNYGDYDIKIAKNSINSIKSFYKNQNRAVIITDDGVPKQWVESVLEQYENPLLIKVKSGEKSKSFSRVKKIIKQMLEENITRHDFIIALGGGVIGDLAGFVASTYMRGIQYINIPTTLLAQVDSSIGGKVAINFSDRKNIVGNFYPPKKVIVDSEVLSTLAHKDILCGIGEVIKYGCIADETIIESLKQENFDFSELVIKCLNVKKRIVENDEFESSERKLLNFGHTIGHAVEILKGKKITHGHAVVIGMIKITSNEEIKKELIEVAKKFDFDVNVAFNNRKALEIIGNDKKTLNKNELEIVLLKKIGEAFIEKITFEDLQTILEGENYE